MMKCFDFIFFKGIDQFRDKAMDVWISFKVPSKSMYSGNHTKFITNGNIFEYIMSIRKFIFLSLSARDLLVRMEMVFLEAINKRLSLELSCLNQFLSSSGIVKTMCL